MNENGEPHAPFGSHAELRSAFEAGLERLLGYEGLGPFILVSANATFDPEIYAHLEERLTRRFHELANAYREALTEGRPLADTDDDLMVLLKMVTVGFAQLKKTEFRHVGPWEVQFNHLRSFRPPRVSGRPITSLREPFDPDGFHFNKPFLAKERFWQGALGCRDVALLYNKYPFAELHGLLVPEGEAWHPQFLDHGHHLWAWQVTGQLGEGLDGVGLGYNAYGAHASVNHLHFQLFDRRDPLPVDRPHWRHNGGTDPYPTRCEAFDDPREAWEFIARLHEANTPYNLLYRPGRLYCLPRRRQGEVEVPAWSGGLSWYELCGGMLTFNRHDFEALEEGEIAAALAAVSAGS